jgi:hypothetical protein
MCRGQVGIAADVVRNDDLAGINIGVLAGEQGTCPGIASGSDYGLCSRPPQPVSRAMAQGLRWVP